MEIKVRNVNHGFKILLEEFQAGLKGFAGAPPVVQEQSRNGPVIRISEPVTITYTHPRERVLLNEARDANPFALLYEALWMLAGRNDVASLAYYTPRFREFSDDGRTLNGAYGYRWRHGLEYIGRTIQDRLAYERNTDQLDFLVAHLKAKPDSRRAVLQMWNVQDDLLLADESKDVCCNTSVMFSVREEEYEIPGMLTFVPLRRNVLDITVTNRSNDLIWGLLGANFVTFSILQEYMAARLGAEVGRYHHFSNNLHVYTETNSGFHPEKWLEEYGRCGVHPEGPYVDYGFPAPVPLVRDPETFERELPEFVERFSGTTAVENLAKDWTEPFLATVAQPMLIAFAAHKVGDTHSALMGMPEITSLDWRLACTSWLLRRAARKGVSK